MDRITLAAKHSAHYLFLRCYCLLVKLNLHFITILKYSLRVNVKRRRVSLEWHLCVVHCRRKGERLNVKNRISWHLFSLTYSERSERMEFINKESFWFGMLEKSKIKESIIHSLRPLVRREWNAYHFIFCSSLTALPLCALGLRTRIRNSRICRSKAYF